MQNIQTSVEPIVNTMAKGANTNNTIYKEHPTI